MQFHKGKEGRGENRVRGAEFVNITLVWCLKEEVNEMGAFVDTRISSDWMVFIILRSLNIS